MLDLLEDVDDELEETRDVLALKTDGKEKSSWMIGATNFLFDNDED